MTVGARLFVVVCVAREAGVDDEHEERDADRAGERVEEPRQARDAALGRLLEARLGPQHREADERRDEHDRRRPAEQPLRDRQVLAPDEPVRERGLGRRHQQSAGRDDEEREQAAPVHCAAV